MSNGNIKRNCRSRRDKYSTSVVKKKLDLTVLLGFGLLPATSSAAVGHHQRLGNRDGHGLGRGNGCVFLLLRGLVGGGGDVAFQGKRGGLGGCGGHVAFGV